MTQHDSPPFPRGLFRFVRLATAVTAAGAFALPVLWLVASSLRTQTETFQVSSPVTWNLLWPINWTTTNYQNMIDLGFARNVWNSVLVAGITVIVGLAISALAAYPLACISFPGRNAIFGIIVVTFLIPFEAVAIPLSVQFRQWGLANTVVGLVLPGLASGLAVFSIRQFFLGIPVELREAAMVDGAGHFRIFRTIYLPLSRPALIGSGMMLFLSQWQAYLWPILMTSDPQKDVGPVSIARNFSNVKVDYGTTFAQTVLIAAIPAVVMLTLQKFFIQSLTMTGSK